MICNSQIALKIHQRALAAAALPLTPLWVLNTLSPTSLVVYYGSGSDPTGELTVLSQTRLTAGEAPPSVVHFKHWWRHPADQTVIFYVFNSKFRGYL
jgi:hypothetical protein